MKTESCEPFWLVKNGIINSYPSLRTNMHLEILVVGGGITGSLIAHRCMEEGYATALIDRGEIGHGSTSASTSMLQYEIDVPLYELIEMIGERGAVESYRACHKSIDDLQEVVQRVKSDCGFKKKRSLYFAAFKRDVSWLKKECEARKKHGFPVQWLEREDIESQYHLRNTYGGILSEQGGSVDAFQLTHDLLAFSLGQGLGVYDKTGIERVEYKRNGVMVVTEKGNTIRADNLIYCTGFESTELIREKFVTLLSTYAIVGERFEGDQSALNNTLLWNTADPYAYIRTTDDNRLLIGGEDEGFVNAKRRDALLKDKSNRLREYLRRILPDYDFRTDFVWAGTFGETKDGLPYIGTHPEFPHTYFVLAFGGNGITFSVLGMGIISGMLKGRTHPLSEYFRFRR